MSDSSFRYVSSDSENTCDLSNLILGAFPYIPFGKEDISSNSLYTTYFAYGFFIFVWQPERERAREKLLILFLHLIHCFLSIFSVISSSFVFFSRIELVQRKPWLILASVFSALLHRIYWSNYSYVVFRSNDESHTNEVETQRFSYMN